LDYDVTFCACAQIGYARLTSLTHPSHLPRISHPSSTPQLNTLLTYQKKQTNQPTNPTQPNPTNQTNQIKPNHNKKKTNKQNAQ
jgi:hypothetical protein